MNAMRGVRRFELVILAAIALSTPSILQALSGGISLTTALVRLALALAICWAVGAVVEGTLDNYARQARHKEIAERIERVKASRAAFFGGEGAGPDAEIVAGPGSDVPTGRSGPLR
ncbi:MAG: hypothetical protein M0014_10645 [Actinomycetota bacterium]|nr:hypothetical protein [Actinomycetota bacterium]